MTEALAGETASFGIKVPIVEPDRFATWFRSSMKVASAMMEYNSVVEATFSVFKLEVSENPTTTAAVILTLVDTDETTALVLLRTGPLPMIKKLYERRINTWDQRACRSL
jgi:hypothetical protein